MAGSVASLVALAPIFFPTQTASPWQDVNVGSGIAGVSNGGSVSIVVNPQRQEPRFFRQPGQFPGEIDYRDLASQASS